jgi:hypothetical protein
MLVAENNAVAAPSPAPTAVTSKMASEIEETARAKMEARILESQQATTARMVESQQAFFTKMETQLQSQLQSKFNEHAVQSRSKEDFNARDNARIWKDSLEAGRMVTEMNWLQHQLDTELQRRKQAEEEAAQIKLEAAQTKLELHQMAAEKADLVGLAPDAASRFRFDFKPNSNSLITSEPRSIKRSRSCKGRGSAKAHTAAVATTTV